ncbi:MAG: HAD family hydrolase [Ghiorsea sp.]
MKETKLNGVLLDLDGTLIDAFAPIIHAMQETLKAFELPAMTDEAIRRHTGRGDCSMIALFGEQKEAASEHFVTIHDQTYLNDIKPLQGAQALLIWLKEHGVPTAVVTSKGQHRAEAQLTKLGWMPYFECIIGKVEGRASKPNPEPLLLACDAMNLPVDKVLMVGDGEADMKAAQRAGCLALGLTHSFSNDELVKSGADVCFQSLDHVLEYLKAKL